MNKKRTIIGGIVVVIALAAGYGWYQFNRTVQGLANVRADFSVNATDLIKEFVSSEDAANKKYMNKILAVKGMVRNVEAAQSTVVLGDTSDMSGVRCVIDSTANSTIGSLQKGAVITIKGAITGFNKDETGLLGSDVQLNRCVIAN
ncbi:hypothetical protein A4D02_08315 [Niastella koreensis]|uniref:Nucleic acid binding OB-fold tRNA/helicase-type n=2 Tax=Niastella koreensis TaxID=354356 RepID=G8TML4_NIAKG|nr:nucleic acid-binding protein [Niastella koreensis]AEW02002.1 nucleic acid binding OB-fold tRNA/helicase-type [Niastella koreensis GR20-10]OQP48697.1 hypothetical protein A4D02_08315 [Niastella koreensis]